MQPVALYIYVLLLYRIGNNKIKLISKKEGAVAKQPLKKVEATTQKIVGCLGFLLNLVVRKHLEIY